jgi:cyclic pyranopterin phosphate synthase
VFRDDKINLIITTGGTGAGPRDITIDTIEDFAHSQNGKKMSGMGEYLRESGSRFVKSSWLSRSECFVVKNKLILCLPGKTSAVREGVNCLGELLIHLRSMMEGKGH